MSNAQALNLLENSLKDMSSSCMKFWQKMALEQRERNSKQAGEVAFWTAIYCLFLNEQQRRRRVMEKTEMDFHGLQEPIIEWTGGKDSDNSTTINIQFPKHIKEDPAEQ